MPQVVASAFCSGSCGYRCLLPSSSDYCHSAGKRGLPKTKLAVNLGSRVSELLRNDLTGSTISKSYCHRFRSLVVSPKAVSDSSYSQTCLDPDASTVLSPLFNLLLLLLFIYIFLKYHWLCDSSTLPLSSGTLSLRITHVLNLIYTCCLYAECSGHYSWWWSWHPALSFDQKTGKTCRTPRCKLQVD